MTYADPTWRVITSCPHLTDIRGPYSLTYILGHREKRWIRFGRYDKMAGRWLYSGTNERSQYTSLDTDDEPTHWMPLPDIP